MDFDDIAELAWLPVLLLVVWTVRRPGLAMLAAFAASGRVQALGTGALGIVGGLRASFGSGLRSVWLKAGMSTGNHSFDAYRADALRKLEDEQREFRAHMDQLRRARDQSEFEQFIAARRRQLGPAPEGTDTPV